MSAQVFALPDLGEGLTEAEIVEWLIDEGDEVAIDQHVVVVETAKATVEVPCPYAGRVTTRHGAAGEVVAVGSPLVTVGAPGGTPTHGSSTAADDAPLAGERQYREEERAGATPAPADEGSGAVLIGYGTQAGDSRRRRRTTSAVAAAPTPDVSAVRVISPIVRRLAKDRGVDVATLEVARRGEVVRRADVEAAALVLAGAGRGRASGTAEQPGDERIPLTGIRRMIADKLSTSRREIPDATTWVDTDATALLAAKDALRAAHPDAGIGVLALMARICVAALRRYPELNASIDRAAQEIVRHGVINLGFAAQSPKGLVVPVVHDAQAMTTRQLATALRALTDKARQGTLSPAELTGGTFTLNNYGVFGVDGSTPILNHPEAAMVGVGRIIDRPWAHEGQVVLRKVTQLGLTFDHRVCDGGSAGGFLRMVADGVQSPVALLADL